MTQQTPEFTGTNAFEVYQKGQRKAVDLMPTYPLDVGQVHSLRETLILNSPKFLVWQLLAQLGSRFTLLSRFSDSWSEIEPQLSEAVVEHVIKQSNAAQNSVVHSLIQALQESQCDEYANTLGHFLRCKQSIEFALRTNRRLAPQRADVETLVDSIMQEVCNEVFLLADLQTALNDAMTTKFINEDARETDVADLEKRIADSRERVGRAYGTIQETEKQTTYQQPAAPEIAEPDIPESIVLDKLIDALREENDVAKTVNERMQSELPRVAD